MKIKMNKTSRFHNRIFDRLNQGKIFFSVFSKFNTNEKLKNECNVNLI